MSEEKAGEEQEQARDPFLRQSVGYARHIKNFMAAIKIVKDCKVKSAEFNKSTRVYRVGDVTRVDIHLAAEQEAINIPETVTPEDLEEAHTVGADAQNFMEAVQMVKDGKVKRIDLNEKTIIYSMPNIVRVDIKSIKL